MKSKFKGALALTMAFSLAFSSMGVNAFAKDNVVVTLAEEAGFEFGSSNVKLSEGSYKLPLAMMKSTDITADSMAKSCIKDAYLTVDKNGKAKIKVNLQAVTIGAITDWAKDWKIYSSSLGSDLTAAEFTTNSDGNVDSITFELPDNSFDGVYANMFITAMASTQDCYFKLDYRGG